MPQPVATSTNPSTPTTVLVANRPTSENPSFTRPCNIRLTADHGSLMLEKKLVTPVRMGLGTTAWYAFATGFSTTLSTPSLNAKTLRFIGSGGSGRSIVAHPPADIARTSTRANKPRGRTKVVNMGRLG